MKKEFVILLRYIQQMTLNLHKGMSILPSGYEVFLSPRNIYGFSQ